MRTPALIAIAATFALTACGGGGGGSATPPTGGGTGGLTPQSQSEAAISVTNALGDPVKSLTNFNGNVSGAMLVARSGQLVRMTSTNGACNNGIEFWAPDKNNDANSTESIYFYDSACTQPARDIVRIFNQSGTSESVNVTEKQYAINNATPIAQRTTTVNFTNGSYDANGFPIAANGFDRSATSELDIANSKTILGDDELVMLPAAKGANSFCGDSAGYNATGIAALNETFGWQGSDTNGTRTVNSDGSVTWQSTHGGNTSKGAIGSLSIAVGSPNSTCPIGTPEYSLQGGTQQGTYSIPVSATYSHGLLTNLVVTNAQLANGNTLNVQTNSSVQPTNAQFITGTISNNGTQIATFAVDAFGDGTLTVTSSGGQYVMNDWHVIK